MKFSIINDPEQIDLEAIDDFIDCVDADSVFSYLYDNNVNLLKESLTEEYSYVTVVQLAVKLDREFRSHFESELKESIDRVESLHA